MQHTAQNALQALKAFARQAYAWPGGYPLYAKTADGAVLSQQAVLENYRLVYRATQNQTDKQWEVAGVEVNWENPELHCEHTNKRIESAYSEIDEESTENE